MEIANLTHTLHTVQIIPNDMYLKRLYNFMLLNYLVNIRDINNSIVIINAFGVYLNEYEFHEEYSNRLTQYLLDENFMIQTNITYDKNFKRILYDHIICSVVFEEYGNIYGFLAEAYRRGRENQTIDRFLNNARILLSSIKKQFQYSRAMLNVNLVERIFHGIIIPLFPGSRGTLINSLDFIYAQAGSILYNSALMKYNYFFDLSIDEKSPKYSSQQYIFDDCLEIGLSVQQLVISGEIPKTALEIFVLPALLNYVQTERKNLEHESIRTIISDQKHWNKALEQLFLKMKKTLEFVNILDVFDQKYKYHLALFHYENETQFAKRMLLENCEFHDNARLEEETVNYVNNSNYTCSENKKLLPLVEALKNRDREFLYKYYFQRKAISDDVDKNRSVTLARGRLTINGESFIVCNNKGSESNSQHVNKTEQIRKLGETHKAGKNRKNFQLRNERNVLETENLTSILEKGENKTEIFISTSEKIEKELPKLESRKNYCFSLLYACIAGIIEGNRISSPNNCPIRGAIRFYDVTRWDAITAQLITFDTRFRLFKFGISMRTIALINSMQTAFKDNNNRTMTPQHLTNNMISDIKFPKFPAIDVGYEIGSILGSDGLNAIENLITTIEKDFFVSYLPATRNYSINFRNFG
ncbi:uncharacterized protein LOC122504007 [Leptopilina heterotoma]|uniref:uncharacterized protein LOC122504007 n=1 Tax=Leptopilina heterotoma TaxID=63436 RepID=UPI001CA9EFE3|nr:uncharacterized protein LOC122504007 [Leptopilina heterotoma]